MSPVFNTLCVKRAIRTGLGPHAVMTLRSRFDPKNSFYPALPQGRRIRNRAHPTSVHGDIEAEPDAEDPITARDLSAGISSRTPANLATIFPSRRLLWICTRGGRRADDNRFAPRPIKGPMVRRALEGMLRPERPAI
jgi:hypothetical protein